MATLSTTFPAPYKHALYPFTLVNNDETAKKIKALIGDIKGDTIFANADLSMFDSIPLSEKITRVVFFDLSAPTESFWNKINQAIQTHDRRGFFDWLIDDLTNNRLDYRMPIYHVDETLKKIGEEVEKEGSWLYSDETYQAVKSRLSKQGAFEFKLIDFSETRTIIEIITNLPKNSLSIIYLSNILTYCNKTIFQVLGFYSSVRQLQNHSPDAILIENNRHQLPIEQQIHYPLSQNVPIYCFHRLTKKLIPTDEVIPILMLEGANPKKKIEEHGWTTLHTCLDKESIFSLVDLGVDIDEQDTLGETPINFAVINGRVAMIQPFLFAGADPKIPDNSGLSPAHWLANRGNVEGLRTLLVFDPKLATLATGYFQFQPIHLAEDRATIELLIAYKADIRVKDKFDFTPLHWAIKNNRRAAIEALLILDLSDTFLVAKNRDNKTAQQLAKELLDLDLVELRKSLTGPVHEEAVG